MLYEVITLMALGTGAYLNTLQERKTLEQQSLAAVTAIQQHARCVANTSLNQYLRTSAENSRLIIESLSNKSKAGSLPLDRNNFV